MQKTVRSSSTNVGGPVDNEKAWSVIASRIRAISLLVVALGLVAAAAIAPSSWAQASASSQPASTARATRPTPSPLSTPQVLGFTPRPPVRPIMPVVVDSGLAPIRKAGTPDPKPSTDHFIVVDGDSGAVLFSKNPYQPMAPASTTKVMTAILGVEYGKLDEEVKVNVDAGSMPGSSLMGLEPWFHVTFRDLLYGLILPSGNDAALAIARYIGGSDVEFVRMMNRKAAWLGLRATHFMNPHGLDTSDHYSSPGDLVTMARYGMQYPLFREVVKAKTYDVRSDNISLELYNVNPILEYPGADGVKTGDTDSAGRALVGTAVRNGHRVYVAFMRSENGALADGTLLLNWAFDSFDWPDIATPPH